MGILSCARLPQDHVGMCGTADGYRVEEKAATALLRGPAPANSKPRKGMIRV